MCVAVGEIFRLLCSQWCLCMHNMGWYWGRVCSQTSLATCDCMAGTGTHVTNGLWAYKPNLVKIHVILIRVYVKNKESIRSQVCTCHDSLAVVACTKLWADCTIWNKIRVKRISTRFRSKTHKLFVKWLWGSGAWRPVVALNCQLPVVVVKSTVNCLCLISMGMLPGSCCYGYCHSLRN